jgi:hypothetical protein
MIISDLQSDILLERKAKTYPRAEFDYRRYNVDSHPDVLVLGDWKHPTTKNNLKAGINLNYLSSAQLKNLQQILPAIFDGRRHSLRSRYRFLRQVAPDIAQMYRTYDQDYMHAIERSEMPSYTPKGKVKPSTKDEKVKTAATKAAQTHTAVDKTPADKDLDDVEKRRQAWRLKQRLYAKPGKRNKPERPTVADKQAILKTKANRYRRDRRKLKELEQQIELANELSRMEKEPEELEPELDLIEPKTKEESYIRQHLPALFEARGVRPLGILDLDSGRVIIDAVSNHAEMLFDAGWDYDHTVLFEVDDADLVVRSDCDAANAIEEFKESGGLRVLLESAPVI